MGEDYPSAMNHPTPPSLDAWLAPYGPFATHPTLEVDPALAEETLRELARRLSADNYPFGHPVYAGQMLKPPHPIAAAAYALAMQINPNNHALDGGPATAAMEREVVRQLAAMVGYDSGTSLGHLTSSGAIANLEALFVARELAAEGALPGRAVAASAAAHYTHRRMCGLLSVPFVPISAGPDGRMDLDALDEVLKRGDVGTVVATGGTTSLGAVDLIDEIVTRCHAAGVRVHLDAAYGGFFRLLADGGAERVLPELVEKAFRAMGACDSVVIDPHKHGLQPYGCGSVLFKDASVGRFYAHDSPYTYFTSDELHLGEISLECSRAGAAAAALWATLRCFPLERERGLGPVLAATRSAAVRWAELIEESVELRLVTPPDLDIVCFYPLLDDSDRRASAISARTQRLFEAGMRRSPDAFFLAKLVMTAADLAAPAYAGLEWDAPTVTVLRSVLMKPEHAALVSELHRRVVETARALATS